MEPKDIKAAIVRAGTTPAAIAAHLKVSVNSVSRVVNGTMRSARIESELKKITGRAIHPSPSKRGRRKTVWNGAAVGAAA